MTKDFFDKIMEKEFIQSVEGKHLKELKQEEVIVLENGFVIIHESLLKKLIE